MRAHELIQLAAILATHGRTIIQSRGAFPDAAQAAYWSAARCRRERWTSTLKSLAIDAGPTGEHHAASCVTPWQEGWPVLAEVLMSEVLARVWAAISCGADDARGCHEAGSIANNVLAGHLEDRNRVLNLMVFGHGLGVEHAVALNRCRLRCERWTDMLLSLLGPVRDLPNYAFDERRVSGWSRGTDMEFPGRYLHPAGSLSLAALTTTCRDSDHAETGNEDLNARIGSSLLACWPPGLFDSLGCPVSSRQFSLFQGSADRQVSVHFGTAPASWKRLRRRG